MLPEQEIADLPPLPSDQQSLLEMHSLLNVFNVLRGELVLVGLRLAGDIDLLKNGLARCDTLIAGCRDRDRSLAAARDIDRHRAAVFAEIDAVLLAHPAGRDDPEIAESRANLASAFAILEVRARELLARERLGDRWVAYSVSELRRNFLDVFSAIERNSHGRFRILYNAALQEPHDYYVDFKIESLEDERLWIPPVFQDVMRDLIANARKYTPPGGRIVAALHESANTLRFVVQDDGRGIPPEDIPGVFEFGRRARNVADVRTLGGGFGLTKALFVVKQHGGRLWIASAPGRGTRLRLELPRPPTG